MSADNKHITPFSAADIEKYRKGELTAHEMHNLEQAALDDPFLADAIEGFLDQNPPQEDLAGLRERLNARVSLARAPRNRKFILQRRTALAAALILLLGIGYTFFVHRSDRALVPTPESAVASSKTPAPPPPTAKSPGPATVATEPATTSTVASKSTTTSPAATKPSTAEPATTSTAAAKPATHVPATVADDETSSRLSSSDADSTALNLSSYKKSLPAAAVRAAPQGALKNAIPLQSDVYIGTVRDPQNHPLAGAFLAFYGNKNFQNTYNYATITDDQGKFRILLQPLDSSPQLSVSMIGYENASLTLNALTANATNNTIYLKPSTTNLDELVVTGYGAHRKATKFEPPSDSREKLDTFWINATPVIGRQAYLQYLAIAKRKLGLDSAVSGTETVSFVVSPGGSLSAFKIEQSLSPAHDAGIVRLVTDGPAWFLLRGKKVRASVTVNFP